MERDLYRHLSPALASLLVVLMKFIRLVIEGPDGGKVLDLFVWALMSVTVSSAFRVYTDERCLFNGKVPERKRQRALLERERAVLIGVIGVMAVLGGAGGTVVTASPFATLIHSCVYATYLAFPLYLYLGFEGKMP